MTEHPRSIRRTVTMAHRIQLRRTSGWRKPEGAIVVSRPSKWGNPFRVGRRSVVEVGDGWNKVAVIYTPPNAEVATLLFREYVTTGIDTQLGGGRIRAPYSIDDIQGELAGRDLACWCPLEDPHGNPLPCHADVLLELANLAT